MRSPGYFCCFLDGRQRKVPFFLVSRSLIDSFLAVRKGVEKSREGREGRREGEREGGWKEGGMEGG